MHLRRREAAKAEHLERSEAGQGRGQGGAEQRGPQLLPSAQWSVVQADHALVESAPAPAIEFRPLSRRGDADVAQLRACRDAVLAPYKTIEPIVGGTR